MLFCTFMFFVFLFFFFFFYLTFLKIVMGLVGFTHSHLHSYRSDRFNGRIL
jgi:hypothetical protein